jgi:hypothetical protein
MSNQDHVPSSKPTHQDPFVITCKITKQTKTKNKPKNNFDALETPRQQQFNHKTELGFATFIHRKHLTLFLGYNISMWNNPTISQMNSCIANLHCTCHVCITISLIHAQLTPNFIVNSCMLNFHHNCYICREDEASTGP